MSDPPGNKRPFFKRGGQRLQTLKTGAHSYETEAARRVAKARKNYAGTSRRAELLKESKATNNAAAKNEANNAAAKKAANNAAAKKAANNAAAKKTANNAAAKKEANNAAAKKEANDAAAKKTANNMRIIADPWSRYIVKELWPLTAGKNKGQGWKPYKTNANITHKITELAPQIRNLGRHKIKKNLNIAIKTGHVGKRAVLGWENQNLNNRKKRMYQILDVAIGGAERNKFKKLINSGANISHADRQRIELVYNNLSKELKARNDAVKTADTEEIRKEIANILTLNNVEKIKPRIVKLDSTFKHWRKQVNSGNLNKLKLKLEPNKSIPALEAFNAQLELGRILNLSNKASINNSISKLNKRRPGWRNTVNKNKLNALETKLKTFAVTNNAEMSNNQKPANQKPSFFSGMFGGGQKPNNQKPSFIAFKQGMKIPLGYVLKTTNNKGTGYYMNQNNKALASQLEHRGYGPASKPTSGSGVSVGVGSGPVNRNRYGNRYGNNRRGPGAPSGGIVFAPKINVGAARIGAQTFGGTRVGGQQMGGSHVRTGNTGSTTLKTGNAGGTSVKTGNAGRLAVSAPATNGTRQLAATPEQLIRGAGGAEAVEKGINALNAANGNVARAKATSRLPNNTFTNIYAMGGPNAAKRLVESRRRRRTVGRNGTEPVGLQ